MFCKSMPDKQKLNYIVSIEGTLEFRKNKAEKRIPSIKLYIGWVLRCLKGLSNIKPFSSVSFYFITVNGICCGQEQCRFPV